MYELFTKPRRDDEQSKAILDYKYRAAGKIKQPTEKLFSTWRDLPSMLGTPASRLLPAERELAEKEFEKKSIE